LATTKAARQRAARKGWRTRRKRQAELQAAKAANGEANHNENAEQEQQVAVPVVEPAIPIVQPAPEPPVSRPPRLMDNWWIGFLFLYSLVLITLDIMLLFEAVPIEIKSTTGDPLMINYTSPTGLILSSMSISSIDVSTHLTLLVLFGGALGGLIHGVSSLQHHYRRRTAESSFILWYIMRPFTGAALAMVVYFALRSGILTTTSVDILSPYGVSTIAIVMGLIEQRALMKIRDVVQPCFLVLLMITIKMKKILNDLFCKHRTLMCKYNIQAHHL
jgi:hypothetical protein